MGDHDEEEELLEIGILLLSRRRNKSKESTNTKKEKCMGSQCSSCKRTLLDLSLKSGDCLLYKQVYFHTSSASFSSNSAAIFTFLEQDWTLLSCFFADRNTVDILTVYAYT